MARLTVRLPDSEHNGLRRLAESQGVSLNKLVAEWVGMAIAQFDAEKRFRDRAARGDAKRGLKLLDKLDRSAKQNGAGNKTRKPKG